MNIIYKIYTEIIVNKLKTILHLIIGEEQNRFKKADSTYITYILHGNKKGKLLPKKMKGSPDERHKKENMET